MTRALEAIDRQDEIARLRGQEPLNAWTPQTTQARTKMKRGRRQGRSSEAVITRTDMRHKKAISITAVVFVVAVLVAGSHYPSLIGAGSSKTSTSSPNFPARGVGEHRSPLGAPQPPPAGSGGYAFENTQPANNTPVAWDPCRAIHYVTAGQPPTGATEMVGDAIAQMSAATGLKFVFDGPTTERLSSANRLAYQPQRYGRRWAPLIVDWSDPVDDPNLSQDIIGLAQPAEVTDASGIGVYVTADVALNSGALEELINKGHAPLAQGVVLHELGHALGLAHVSDPTQIMYPEAHIQTTTLGGGDRRGLALLGEGRCFPNV